MSDSEFVFCTCQVGAETVCKQAILSQTESARFAFSRPGCLTFKVAGNQSEVMQALERNPFARTWGHSLAVVKGDSQGELLEQVWPLIDLPTVDHLHVWQRDRTQPGARRIEPAISEEAEQLGRQLIEKSPHPNVLLNRNAGKEQIVVDVIMLEENEWLVGWHPATTHVTCWPGGLPPLDVRHDAPSRAYLKTLEALAWSKLPVQKGDLCAEIGSAPGGSCTAILQKGLRVIGIDPAEMDEEVLAHPNFEHWRMRGNEVKRKSLAGVRWLLADSNVAPQHTLDTVGELHEHSATNFRGLLLTLKLPDWKLAAELPTYMSQVRAWGFGLVKIRQLVHNRQEVCLFALRNKSLLRVRRK